MDTYINLGNAGFALAWDVEYVDKLGLIAVTNNTLNSPRRFSCVMRSRRSGKSMAAEMLCAYISAKKDHVIHRELPTGKGFADIVFIPRHNVTSLTIILELKYGDSAQSAINKIKSRDYAKIICEEYGRYPSRWCQLRQEYQEA